MAPSPWSLLLFLAFLSPSFSSPPAEIPYADYCSSTVPASNPTVPLDTYNSFQLSNAYFSGGSRLLGPDPDSGTSSSNSFRFRTKYLHHTQTPDILQLHGTLVLYGGNTRALESWTSDGTVTRYNTTVSKTAAFHLSGFWSESTGKLCMVGRGSLKHRKGGSSLDLSAILRLHYPGKSNIFTSLVSGSVQSLDAVSSPNYFDSISILAYAQENYEYTMISQADESCSRLKPQEQSVQFDSKSYCRRVQRYAQRYNRAGQVFKFNYQNDCSGRNCGPFGASLKDSHTSMSLNLIHCSEDGKLRMYMGFSNVSGHRYNGVFLPDKSLVGEGHWDRTRNRLCLIACRILNAEGDSLAKASVGDCTIGLSLWFPAVLSIRSTSAAVGRIWSNMKESDPGYFSNISFSRLENHFGSPRGVKYKYTELDKVKKFCAENDVTKSEKRRYPDGSSFEDMSFHIDLKNSKGENAWGRATPISIGEMYYGNAGSQAYVSEDREYHGFDDPIAGTELNINQTHWNVSYMLSYTFQNASLDVHDPGEVSAEGIYNSETGILCMVGCRYPNSLFAIERGKEVNSGSMDCEILINLQLPPLNPEVGENSNGTIRSRREKSDPLFFDPLEVSVYGMYRVQAVETLWRMDIEIVMAVISLTLYCIFVGIQLIYHVKKHFPSVSITMLVVLTVGRTIPLVLNFGALFPKNHNQWNTLQDSTSAQLEASEVMVRVMTMVAFLLHCRLLQVAWSSRSAEDAKKGLWVAEGRTFKSCLLLYLAGGLIAWFVHTATSHEVVVYGPNYIVEHHRSPWKDLMSYAGLILDCFLLPQIILNMFWNSKDKALNPFFYVGTTMVRILPHLYDVFRAHHYVHLKWSYIYASHEGDFYSTVWDIIIPCLGLLFAFLIYLQQRFGGDCILPKKYRRPREYEVVPAVGP